MKPSLRKNSSDEKGKDGDDDDIFKTVPETHRNLSLYLCEVFIFIIIIRLLKLIIGQKQLCVTLLLNSRKVLHFWTFGRICPKRNAMIRNKDMI